MNKGKATLFGDFNGLGLNIDNYIYLGLFIFWFLPSTSYEVLAQFHFH